MKTKKLAFTISLLLSITCSVLPQSVKEYTMPDVARTEVLRLKEAYHILDQFAETIWPEWRDYQSFPFMFNFQNNLRILINYPDPSEEFERYTDPSFGSMKVYVDHSKQNELELALPLQLGGGLAYVGRINNKAIWQMNMELTKKEIAEEGDEVLLCAESHILVFLHELMHCYQQDHFKINYGNLSINPDENFASYSTLEGLALNKALEAKDDQETRRCLIDFCMARQFKNMDLTERERHEAAADESREGQAVFVELMTIQTLSKGYQSTPEISSDPDFNHFKKTGALLNRYQKRLKTYTGKMLEIYEKNYQYGSYQALFLNRLFTDWQKEIESGTPFNTVLQNRLNISSADSLLALSRFQDIYNFSEVCLKAKEIIESRNMTYTQFTKIKGQAYVINFRPIKQWLDRIPDDSIERYKLGLLTMYPTGMGDFKVDGIKLEMKKNIPVQVDQLFHMKMIDENPNKREQGYSVSSAYQDEEGIYHDAIIQTPLFELQVPQVSIVESEGRIKFIVHSRI